MTDELQQVAAALPAYEIGGELGRGGWGVVLAGRHRHLHRNVAIKKLPATFASDPEVRSRFVAEARLLASLDHPHIVPIYDFVERDGLCLLVMEQLSGGTVWTRFTTQGLEAQESCAVALVTAVALHHAHQHGVLHRDIKPENLLYTSDSRQLKVADFGTAKVLSGSQTLATRAGDVVGTPAYMAPEQATGSPVTPATDVYALGTMLYELLSGSLPFAECETPLAMLYQRVHGTPTPLDQAAPAIDVGLVELVSWTLRTEPTERPPSAEAFALALAERATQSFGQGWFARTGYRASLGSQIAAITERPGATASVTVPSAPQRPERSTRVVDAVPEVRPSSLVPVADIDSPARDDTLRELRLLLARADSGDARRLAHEIERAESTAHELHDLALLRRIRSATEYINDADTAEIERLVGATGLTPSDRLGLPADANDDEIRTRLIDIAARWKRTSENPFSARAAVGVAHDVVRTCERLLTELGSQ
jgi:serine/threonine protein kinase